MEYIQIAPGMEFSRIIQGFWRLGDWNFSKEELRTFLEGCMERGVNTFDTAELYHFGESERQLGAVFAEMNREDYKVVTKTGIVPVNPETGVTFKHYDTRYDSIINACKNSLQRLKCEYIDLYLIHREDPLLNPQEVADAFKELKKQGLVREFGVSNFDPYKYNGLDQYMDGTLRTNQVEWNPCCFEYFENGIMDTLTAKKVSPMIWSPLAGGRIFTNEEPVYKNAREVFQKMADEKGVSMDTLVYAWILYHPVKAMPICGSSKLERLDAAVQALDVKLEHEEWYRLFTASKQKILR